MVPRLIAAIAVGLALAGPVDAAAAARGKATYYCDPGIVRPVSRCTTGHPAGGFYAAAGPGIRAAFGPAWRGRVVRVTSGWSGRSVLVQLIDWCACAGDHLIDLYSAPFAALEGDAGYVHGEIPVVVTAADGTILPPTDWRGDAPPWWAPLAALAIAAPVAFRHRLRVS